MRRVFILLIALTILIIVFVVYRSRSDRLNVDPNAAQEIEKAKRR